MSKYNLNKTYQIEPQENAASKYPLSFIDNEVGEFNPMVSNY